MKESISDFKSSESANGVEATTFVFSFFSGRLNNFAWDSEKVQHDPKNMVNIINIALERCSWRHSGSSITIQSNPIHPSHI